MPRATSVRGPSSRVSSSRRTQAASVRSSARTSGCSADRARTASRSGRSRSGEWDRRPSSPAEHPQRQGARRRERLPRAAPPRRAPSGPAARPRRAGRGRAGGPAQQGAGGSGGAAATGSAGAGSSAGASGSTTGDAAAVNQWRVSEQTNLPEPRANGAGFTANGALYFIGGTDGAQPRSEMWWATPNASGAIDGWKHLAATDLPPQGLTGSAALASGSHAFLVGGQTKNGITPGSARTNLAPQEPFFQVGVLGATVPALKLEGEIGQQLGYLNAAGVGTVDFILLLIIGWAFAHKERTRELLGRFRRR